MFGLDMLALLGGPIIILFTIFSLKKVGLDSLLNNLNGKDRKIIPLIALYAFVVILFSYAYLPVSNVIAAIYTLIFWVIPSAFMVWFIIKKLYLKKNMGSAITFVHVIAILSVNRLVNYFYLDIDDAVFFWLACYAALMCYGMLEGGKSKKKLLMLAAIVVAMLGVMVIGKIDFVNIIILAALLVVENAVLFVIQDKFRIFRNIIRQGVLLLVAIGFVILNSRI